MSNFSIKEHLLAGMAVLMVLFLSTSVLLYLQADALEEKLANANGTIVAQEDHINTLSGINESNQQVLGRLEKRIEVVADSMADIMKSREDSIARYESIKRQLNRLEKNDEIMQKYLDSPIPNGIIELLKPENKDSNRIEGGGDGPNPIFSADPDKAVGTDPVEHKRLNSVHQVPTMSGLQGLSRHP